MTKVEKMIYGETIKGYKGCIGPRAVKPRAQSEHQKRHHPVKASLSKDGSATQRKERQTGGVWLEPGGRISQMQKAQPCHTASASSTEGPQSAQRQRGFSTPGVIAEIPQRDPQMQPQEMRWNCGCRLRVPSPKMGAV